MGWKIFQNIWARGRIKACVVNAGKYEGLPGDSCVLMFGGLNDNPDPLDTGIPGGKTMVHLLHDGWIDLTPV